MDAFDSEIDYGLTHLDDVRSNDDNDDYGGDDNDALAMLLNAVANPDLAPIVTTTMTAKTTTTTTTTTHSLTATQTPNATTTDVKRQSSLSTSTSAVANTSSLAKSDLTDVDKLSGLHVVKRLMAPRDVERLGEEFCYVSLARMARWHKVARACVCVMFCATSNNQCRPSSCQQSTTFAGSLPFTIGVLASKSLPKTSKAASGAKVYFMFFIDWLSILFF